ncbi:MAG TPA: hypothetical protein PKZ83_07490, partial [bacterium]|nr:hypothetical protein [bacterium]HQJ65129.1 hypothetical protein [bacterium]
MTTRFEKLEFVEICKAYVAARGDVFQLTIDVILMPLAPLAGELKTGGSGICKGSAIVVKLLEDQLLVPLLLVALTRQ